MVPREPLVEGRDVDADHDIADLYRTHRTRLLRLAAAITMDRALAEEVVQDAFVGLHRHAARVETPIAYLQRSVVNHAVTVVRTRRRRVAPVRVLPTIVASTPEIDETWSAVTALPVNHRAVIVLRFWEDMTVDQIATTLGWPVGSVKSTLHRALRRLEEVLR